MSSEEEDYMSDTFLSKCVDVKPGLKMTYSKKRDHELAKRRTELQQEQKKRKTGALESEIREEGLNKRLDESNKGFALMAKMGYKVGEGLGTSGGRVDPVPIQMKSGRGGLGRDALLAEIKKEKADRKSKRNDNVTSEDFRKAMSSKSKNLKIESDLKTSQKVCEQLDLSNDIKTAAESWFWPARLKERSLLSDDHEERKEDVEDNDDEDDEEETSLDPYDQLYILTTYLRNEYYYCIWCGHRFQDLQDLKQHCPGRTKEDHDEL